MPNGGNQFMPKFDFEKVCNHFIVSGFYYQGSEIYGGLSNTWDYGPLGSELKNNIRKMWWKRFVQESPTNVGSNLNVISNGASYYGLLISGDASLELNGAP